MKNAQMLLLTDQPPTSGYLKKIAMYQEKIQAHFSPGDMAVLEIRHDTDCPFLLKTGTCSCDPDLVVKLVLAADEPEPSNEELDRRYRRAFGVDSGLRGRGSWAMGAGSR